MRKPLILVVLFFCFVYVCCVRKANLKEITLYEFSELASKDSLSILLCDFRQYNHLYKNKQTAAIMRHTDERTYYIDVSLPCNREIQFINRFSQFPVLVSMDTNFVVYRIIDYDGVHNVDQSSEILNSIFLKGYCSLLTTPDSLLFQRLIADSSLVDNFYCNTLLARYYDKKHRLDSAKSKWDRAALLYEQNPERETESLYIDTMRNVDDTLSHIVSSSRVLNVGLVPSGSTITHYFTISNYGVRPFILYRVRPSCSCVKVKYPRIIEPGHMDTLTVDFLAGEEKGPFKQSININSNTILFTINGTIQ